MFNNMSHSEGKRKAEDDGQRRKKRQLVLAPRYPVEPILSDTSTLPYYGPSDVGEDDISSIQGQETLGDETLMEIQEHHVIVSDDDSLESLSDDDCGTKTTDPLRNDMAIVRTRWESEEVDALMTALNVNRDAVKFHFDGPGGGKDVKRQGWIDVASYVNDVANTHRTVKQCHDKADDYTQRVKAKYNRLRFAISQTGRGAIKDGLRLKPTEQKALDYLREEAVRGIPGILAIEIGGPKNKKPSKKNAKLLWQPDRDTKPEYEKVAMKKLGVPKNYRDKNNRRVVREEKAKRKKEHEIEMKKERKAERIEAKVVERQKKQEEEMRYNDDKKMKIAEKKERHLRRENRQKKRQDRAEKKKAKRVRSQERKAKKEKKKEKLARQEKKKEKLAKKEKKKGKLEKRKKDKVTKGHDEKPRKIKKDKEDSKNKNE